MSIGLVEHRHLRRDVYDGILRFVRDPDHPSNGSRFHQQQEQLDHGLHLHSHSSKWPSVEEDRLLAFFDQHYGDILDYGTLSETQFYQLIRRLHVNDAVLTMKGYHLLCILLKHAHCPSEYLPLLETLLPHLAVDGDVVPILWQILIHAPTIPLDHLPLLQKGLRHAILQPHPSVYEACKKYFHSTHIPSSEIIRALFLEHHRESVMITQRCLDWAVDLDQYPDLDMDLVRTTKHMCIPRPTPCILCSGWPFSGWQLVSIESSRA